MERTSTGRNGRGGEAGGESLSVRGEREGEEEDGAGGDKEEKRLTRGLHRRVVGI
jgi:hypothetical protein